MDFSDPVRNINALHLRDGATVADLGAGVGAYTLAAARRVGEHGRVYAIDVQKDLLANITSAAKREGLSNVEILWGDAEIPGGTKLADNSVDAAIASNIFFQAEDKRALIREIKRILKKDGKVVVIDWSESFGGLGPRPEAVIKEPELKRMFGEEGFLYQENISTGEYHFGIIFMKG